MTESELLELLDEKGVAYELYRHAPIFSANEPTPASIAHPENIIKNLLLETADHSRRFLATLRASDRADLKDLARQLGCGHLSFVPGEQMQDLIGVTPGSATPFGMIGHEGNATFVIDDALPGTQVCCHPMHNEASIELACNDLLRVLSDSGVRIVTAAISKRPHRSASANS